MRTEEERLKKGIPVAEATLSELKALGASLGIPFPPVSSP